MKQKKKIWASSVCIGILLILCVALFWRIFVRQVFVKKLGMNNAFTECMLAGTTLNNGDGESGTKDVRTVDIDWKALYPFEKEEAVVEVKQETAVDKILQKYNRVVSSVEQAIQTYTTNFMPGYHLMVEGAKVYNKFIGWNYVPYSEYNGVITLSDGYLSSYIEPKDVAQHAEELISFKNFCENEGTSFLYVQAPYKISEYDDLDVTNTSDFSNANANEFIKALKQSDTDVLDLRELIHQEGFNNHDMFYRTDHHWTVQTGLWATQRMLGYCNENYGWNADLSKLDITNFDEILYPNWFLGSQGRKVTLAATDPEDFVMILPKYDTNFHYVIPSIGMDEEGDYSITYNMDQIEVCDYYLKSPYSGCNYGDLPLVQIENLLDGEDHRILLIRDSFSDCVISCLASAEKEVYALDLRYFTGSVKKLVQELEPDLVIVMYNPNMLGGEIERSSHIDAFDFE